ncbi:MAG: hypothetical protein V1692_00935 [bacterium]
MTGAYSQKPKKLSRIQALMNLLRAKKSLIGGGLAVLTLSLGIAYLAQANGLSTQGYQMNTLKNKIADLEGQNQQLELSIAELQSIRQISERVESLGMVKVAVTDYLSTTGSSVAVR